MTSYVVHLKYDLEEEQAVQHLNHFADLVKKSTIQNKQ